MNDESLEQPNALKSVESETTYGLPQDRPSFEPRTGLPIGVWIDGESCWAYRGTLPVVIQFAKPSPEYTTEPMCVSRCPPCERRTLMDKYPSRKVKRWLILPS